MERGLGIDLGPDISKRLIHPGKGEIPDYRDGTKVNTNSKFDLFDPNLACDA